MPLLEPTKEQRDNAFAAAGVPPISSTNLQNAPALQITQPQPLPIPVVPQLPPAPTEKPANPTISRFEEITAKLSGKEATATNRATTAAQPFQQQLNQINEQIATHQATSLQRQEQALNSGETMGYATGLAAQAARNDAIETLKLTAIQQGLQGNVLLAQKTATDAVNAEFAEREQELQTLRTNILDNYDTFTGEQKKRADAALLKLDKDDAFVAQQKADKTATNNYVLTALKYGAPSDVIARAQAAGSSDEALSILSAYMQDPKAKYELESARLDTILKQKEIADFGKPSASEVKDAQALDAANKTAVEVANSTLDIATQLRDMVKGGKGNSVVGRTRIFNAGIALAGSDAATVKAKFDQLKDSLALGNIDKLKGAMSDKDIEFLRNTASSIRLNLPEDQFVAELDAIINRMEGRVLDKAFDPSEREALDEMWATGGATSPVINPAAFFDN